MKILKWVERFLVYSFILITIITYLKNKNMYVLGIGIAMIWVGPLEDFLVKRYDRELVNMLTNMLMLITFITIMFIELLSSISTKGLYYV